MIRKKEVLKIFLSRTNGTVICTFKIGLLYMVDLRLLNYYSIGILLEKQIKKPF